MRILLDHGTPAPLRQAFTDHSVATAYERGWAGLTNGELLAVAAAAIALRPGELREWAFPERS